MAEDITDLLRAPWFSTNDRIAQSHITELRNELGANHPLFPKRDQLTVIAKCGGNDDVLVADRGSPDQFYCVHLTWAQHPEPEGFPTFKPIARDSLEDFFRSYGAL